VPRRRSRAALLIYDNPTELRAGVAGSRVVQHDRPLTLSSLRGRVVVLAAFQVLCPNSIASGVPQARRIHETFAPSDVAVIGMHTTFEHHDAFSPAVLKAFIQEYRLKFPIALDQPNPAGPIPHTMERYKMRGTPSLVLNRSARRGAQACLWRGRRLAHRRRNRRVDPRIGNRRARRKFGGLREGETDSD